MKHIALFLSFAGLATLVPAQLLFHEDFSFDIPASQTQLGTLNGWQQAWNVKAESQATLTDLNLHWESPFPKRGVALQVNSTKQAAFRLLPETLNAKTVYFSFLFRFFQETGGTGQFRIRSDEGHVLAAGFQDGGFLLRAQGEQTSWGKVRDRETYMMIGKITINQDGSVARISASAHSTRAAIPVEAPDTWSGEVEHKGPARRWHAVECFAASQNVVFDDIRIGTAWADVAGKRR